MTYVFDIDGTICTKAVEFDYESSKPLKGRISLVNKLYDSGNTIIFQTARGMGRFENDAQKAIETFYEMTANQLEEWGVKYHQLFLGKPAGDTYIDDKGVRDIDFFDMMRETRDE
jgi:CMP-N,N'-diacetyllegionaminic acid synthase